MRRTGRILTLIGAILTLPPAAGLLLAQDGATLFGKWCAVCHEAGGDQRAPTRTVLSQLTPEQILVALETGPMRDMAQYAMISRPERRALAEYLSGKAFGSAPVNPIPKSAFCADSANSLQNSLAGPAWNGFGVTITQTRFESAADAGITADEVPRLKLKWAFGFPGASSASSQPVVLGGRVYVGSWEGDFYSLNAKTGCIDWTIQAEAGIRSAASIGKTQDGRLAIYFGDLAANIYALDATTGKQLWKAKVDDYPAARITGSPTLFQGRLYVPVSSREESRVGPENFECCKFRGSVVALDASSGKQIWKTYTITQEPQPTEKNRAGTQLFGPSGVAVWNSPTIDVKRNTVYVGTGNNYSSPATSMSDSIIALDMDSGKIRWFHRFTVNELAKDVWNGDCEKKDRDPGFCPDADAPDLDFSATSILIELQNGQEVLIAQNKSDIYALDPDKQGKIIWQQHPGPLPGRGGATPWGSASDRESLYVANAQGGGRLGGGMTAFNLRSGAKLWSVPAPSPCGEQKPCSQAENAAIALIPGVVFSASMGGHLFAYSTEDGKVLWNFNTVGKYKTVNGVEANGGSISNGGPSVVGGMLFINSGYSHHGGYMPGNVLLAFSVEGGS